MNEFITIGFSKPRSFKPFAWLIMKFYSIPFDHVYIKFYSEKYDRTLIYQASKSIVNFMNPEIFHLENISIEEFDVQILENKKIELVQFCIDNAGKSYGILEAFGLGIVRLIELIGYTIKNPFSDKSKTYICSELSGIVLEQFTNVKIEKSLDDLTPLDIFNYLKKLK